MISHLSYERVPEVSHIYLDRRVHFGKRVLLKLSQFMVVGASVCRRCIHLVNLGDSYEGFPCSFKNISTFDSEIANSIFPFV
jgi:hypothetical protein